MNIYLNEHYSKCFVTNQNPNQKSVKICIKFILLNHMKKCITTKMIVIDEPKHFKSKIRRIKRFTYCCMHLSITAITGKTLSPAYAQW